MRRICIATVLGAWVLAGCGTGSTSPCAGTDVATDVAVEAVADVLAEAPSDPGLETPVEVGVDVPVDVPVADPGPVAPTYWSAAATKVVDDLQFLVVKDPATGESKRLFGLGIHPSRDGAWDGVTGANGCQHVAGTETALGMTNDGIQSVHLAAAAGANLAYTWGYDNDCEYLHVDPPFFGIWHPEYGTLDATCGGPGHEAIPVAVCDHGEEDMDGWTAARVQALADDFAAFQARTGKYSKDSAPTLPDDVKYYCWHPTFRMIGGGDGMTDYLTDEHATQFAQATNFLIGDDYTYVCNRYDMPEGILYGQVGPKGQCYDDWLAADDPAHRGYFSASWDLTRSLRTKAKPDAVVWMWQQGHAMDDDIGGSTCWNGSSDLWARGPFPTQRYLRKEILSTVAAGGTGFIYFGYGYSRAVTAEQARIPLRALSLPEVYGPVLLSPRLDVGTDTQFLGEGGRAHALAKWDEASRTAFLVGANPGARRTDVEVTFPWTVAKVEVLDWYTPQFVDATDVQVDDRTLRWTAPEDDGFLFRVTPLQAP